MHVSASRFEGRQWSVWRQWSVERCGCAPCMAAASRARCTCAPHTCRMRAAHTLNETRCVTDVSALITLMAVPQAAAGIHAAVLHCKAGAGRQAAGGMSTCGNRSATERPYCGWYRILSDCPVRWRYKLVRGKRKQAASSEKRVGFVAVRIAARRALSFFQSWHVATHHTAEKEMKAQLAMRVTIMLKPPRVKKARWAAARWQQHQCCCLHSCTTHPAVAPADRPSHAELPPFQLPALHRLRPSCPRRGRAGLAFEVQTMLLLGGCPPAVIPVQVRARRRSCCCCCSEDAAAAALLPQQHVLGLIHLASRGFRGGGSAGAAVAGRQAAVISGRTPPCRTAVAGRHTVQHSLAAVAAGPNLLASALLLHH